jgi:hypothetical protein
MFPVDALFQAAPPVQPSWALRPVPSRGQAFEPHGLHPSPLHLRRLDPGVPLSLTVALPSLAPGLLLLLLW